MRGVGRDAPQLVIVGTLFAILWDRYEMVLKVVAPSVGSLERIHSVFAVSGSLWEMRWFQFR